MPILTAATGQAGFVSALESGITADALWGALTPFASLIVTIVVFAFGFRIAKKLVNHSPKGQARMG